MAARYVSSRLIEYVVSGARAVAVEYVDRTSSWMRPTAFPSAQIKSDFTQVVRENLNALKPETTRVGMKESEHQSDMDQRMHYTAFELDNSGNVIATTHFVRKK